MSGGNNTGSSAAPSLGEILQHLPGANARPLFSAFEREVFETWVKLARLQMWMHEVPGAMRAYVVALKNFMFDYQMKVEHVGATLGGPGVGFACSPSFAGTICPRWKALNEIECRQSKRIPLGKKRCVVEMHIAEPFHPHMGPLLAGYAQGYAAAATCFPFLVLRFSVLLRPDTSTLPFWHTGHSDFELLEYARKQHRRALQNENPFKAFLPNENRTGRPTLPTLPSLEDLRSTRETVLELPRIE